MKLADWLRTQKLSRLDFARRIGVSPASITQLCNSGSAWMSRDMAELICRETGGAVTPNDFIPADLVTADTAQEERPVTHSVISTIEAFARGELVIVTDDDD